MAQSLANKYRPAGFDDVIGQTVVVDIVKKMCESDQLSNRNFLFTGPAGCGKTTISRIIAKSLNGNLDNIIEVDAASHSGVDDVRELIQQASQYPIGSKYKLIICDECFPGNTWVTTPSGKVQIKDLHIGDRVCNLQGQTTITHVFENRVATSNLISIIVDGKQIITTKNHLFFTDDGWVEACNLHIGDHVYDYSLLQTMRKTISSEITQQSKDSVQSGMPQDLDAQQDVWQTYQRISKNMSDMWQRLLHSEECKCNNLLSDLWVYLDETESKYGAIIGATFKTLAYIYLSRLWDSKGDQEQSISEVLQYQVCRGLGTATSQTEETCNQGVRMVQEFIYRELFGSESEDLFTRMSMGIDCSQAEREKISEIFRTNETEKSNVRSEHCSQDGCNEEEERNFASMVCIAWWKRTIYCPSDYAASGSRGRVDIRVRGVNSHNKEGQSESLSYELQTRPCLRGQIIGNRGGWCESQIEIPTVARCQESRVSAKSRVDSVEIYQRGNNDELFWCSFSDNDLSQEYVTMYDIEVKGHPSYFVDDILVHNCHAFSSQSWQALLKCLEEQVGNTIWIFATTNPEKIPGTIISRVQTFKLSKISTENITKRLKFILDSEISEGQSITYDEKALTYIAKISGGGLRDAITLLDKSLAFDNNITTELLERALDLPSYEDYFRLLNALVKKDNSEITSIIDQVYNSGTNYIKWFEGFHSFLCNIVKYVFLKDISRTMIPYHYLDKIQKYNEQHAFVCLKLANIIMAMNKELKTTQYLMETTITYLCSATPSKK